MTIVFFYESIALGGQQTQTYQLVRRLAALGHRVTWVYLEGEALREAVAAHAAVDHIDIPLRPRDYRRRPWRVLRVTRALTRRLRTLQADVVISGSGLGSLIAGVAARRTGAVHFRLVGCSMRQVEPTLLRYYRMIGADSLVDGYFGWPAVFEELRSKGVPTAKCIEFNNAVDTDAFRPDPAAGATVRRTLGIKDHTLVIGWIGRISADMQVGNTIEAARRLRDNGFSDFAILLVGGGPWVDGLNALIDRYGLRAHVRSVGWIPMTEVPDYVNAMDVVPLLETDPQGGSIVREAMACGRVALSVDGVSGTQRRFMLPDCTRLVAPEGFLDRAATEMRALAVDPELRARIGDAARAYAEREMSFETQVATLLGACAAAGLGD